ncbi:MAG: glycosyltransferase family 39 protein [Oscillospiraceae bacterium]|nr:glycosyltransferase family 39 protein [Oscillospiraceae bacterium]
MTTFNHILLVAAIALCSIVIYKSYIFTAEGKTLASQRQLKDMHYKIALGAVLFLAFFIRVYKFGSVPGGFNQDGAMAAVDAKAIADYGTDRYGMWMPVHLTAWGYGQMSSLLSYLMVPFIKLFSLNPITARLPQLIVSMAGLVCLYLFIRDVFGKGAALVVLIFAVINPWHILQSRWALDCNLYPHFFIMGIYFLNKGLDRKLFLVISMIMFGLCMYCYGISIYTMPLFLLAACVYLLITKKLTIKDAILALVVYLLVAWPFITTMVINFLKHDTIKTPFFTIPYFPNSVRSNDILFFSDDFLAQLKNNFKSLMNVTLLQKKDLPWNDVEGFGTIYLFSMPFTIVGIFALIKDHRKSMGAVLALMFLLTGIWCGLTTNGVNVNRINIVYYPIIIMSGIGICYAIKWMAALKWGIAAAYLLAFILFINTYFTSYSDMMDRQFFKNFGDAVTALRDSDAEKLYITADSQYEGASNVSEILTMFYHQTDAEYYQGKKEIKGFLPFKERYTFRSIKNITINPDEDAAYVVTGNDLYRFDRRIYDFTQFGDYYVVEKR